MREEVIAYEAPKRFSYTVLSGLPVRDHVGTVELTPDAGGTKMVYVVRTQPTLPVVGPVVVAAIKQAIKGLIGGVAKESERRAAAGG
jgi:polyketide cyclase/dehydrase/lipid transport protein